MRTLVLIVVAVGATIFFMSRSHVVTIDPRCIANAVESTTEQRPISPRKVVVSAPRAVAYKTTTVRTNRNTSKEPGYSFAVKGYAPTAEEAKKDALDQASRVVRSALNLAHASVNESQLAGMISDTQDESDVPLGSSDGKELGAGKKVSLTFELTREYLRELVQQERGYVMEERMGWLARGLAVIVTALFAISGYVRLDELSKGYFTGVLRTVAILAVAGAGTAAYLLR